MRRSDFGITWNQTIEGTRVVADDLQIELRVEAENLLTPPALSPALMINTLEQNNGPHPGFRRIHAKGVGREGERKDPSAVSPAETGQ